MKTIAIIATGGTIAGTGQIGKASAYRAGEIGMDEIIETIPMIKDMAHIQVHQIMNIDSNEMNNERWLLLMKTINKVAQDDEVDGIVVTHGTDTIEETAYFLTLTLHTLKPVVLTGAMRPATATSPDGPYNLYQAIALAGHPDAYDQGVMLLFSNTIYSARDIQKVNNYKIDAFDQKSFGCLGYMQDDQVYFFSKIFKKHTQHSLFSHMEIDHLPEVAIVYFYAGAHASMLYDLSQDHEGIVIAGSGNGNYDRSWLEAINDLSEKGIIFVRASRVIQGIVLSDEIFDPHHYCISANTLSPQKARILLMLALLHSHQREEIRKIFHQY